jgi:DNA-binding MarR family transcriptional regulator
VPPSKRPAAPPSQETAFLLQRAHRRVRLSLNEALAPSGLAIAHVGVLGLLFTHGPLSQRRLIEMLDADKSTMVNLIDELEAQKLAERHPDPNDRRAHAVHLTDTGRRRLTELGAVVHRIQEAFFAPLSPRERTQLDDMLRRLADHAVPPPK